MRTNERKKISLVMILFMLFSMFWGAMPVSATSDVTTENGFTCRSGTITAYEGGPNVVIPSTVGGQVASAISETLFRGNTTITSVSLPDSMKYVPIGAFRGCTNLTTFTTSKIEIISEQGFTDCTSLSVVKLPATLKYIGNNAFGNCKKLRTIQLDGTPPDTSFMGGINPSTMVFTTGSSLTAYNADTNWNRLRIYANDDPTLVHTSDGFYAKMDSGKAKIVGYDGSATDVVIPDSIPFGGGTLPVKSIGKTAFYGNPDITSVSIPDVEGFDASQSGGTFQACFKLKKTLFRGSAPVGIGWTTFNGCAPQFSIRFTASTGFETPIWNGYRCFKEIDPGQYHVYVMAESGGTIQVTNKPYAAAGELVQLTVMPTAPSTGIKNLRYISGFSDSDVAVIHGTSFTMPAADVTIRGTFYQDNGGTWVNISDPNWSFMDKESGIASLTLDNQGEVRCTFLPDQVVQYNGLGWSGGPPVMGSEDLQGIAVDGNGVTCLATIDKGGETSRIVQRLGPNWIDISGTLNPGLGRVMGFCSDSAGSLYVSEMGKNVVFKRSNNAWAALPPAPLKTGECIYSLSADRQGNLYALIGDDTTSHVWRYSGGTWTPLANGDPQNASLGAYAYIAVDDARNIYATNYGNVYKLTGDTWRDITGSLNSDWISGLAVSGSGTVYAADAGKKVWKLQDTSVQYTVTFDKNGGSADAAPTFKTVTRGGAVGTLPIAPTKSQFTFSGWNTAANGTGTGFTAATAVNSNITVYAQWTAVSTNGGSAGSGSSSSNSNQGTSAPAPAPVPAPPKPVVLPSPALATPLAPVKAPTPVEPALKEQKPVQAKIGQTGVASVAVGSKEVESALTDAKKSKIKELALAISAPKDAKVVETKLKRDLLTTIQKEAIKSLSLDTPLADLSLNEKALKTLHEKVKGEVSVTVEAKVVKGKTMYDFRITSGGKAIAGLDGNVEIRVPYILKAGETEKNFKFYVADSKGRPVLVKGAVYNPKTKVVAFKYK